jgi:hypothetical protein
MVLLIFILLDSCDATQFYITQHRIFMSIYCRHKYTVKKANDKFFNLFRLT